MALLTISVVGVTLSATLIAISQPQDTRSQASEPAITPPTITALTVELASQSATPVVTPKPLITSISNSDKEEPSSSASAAIQQFTGSDVTGVRFIYTLLGLGILIGGGAFALIWVVQKVLGGQT